MRVFEPIHQFPGAQNCGFRVPSRACRLREKSELLVLNCIQWRRLVEKCADCHQKKNDPVQQRERESECVCTCKYFKLDFICLICTKHLCFAQSWKFKLMSEQFVTGPCAQNSQTHLPRPAGLKVGSSTLSGSNNAKLPAELFTEGAALRPRQR